MHKGAILVGKQGHNTWTRCPGPTSGYLRSSRGGTQVYLQPMAELEICIYLLVLSLTNGTSGLIGDPVCPFVSYALLGGRPLIGNTSATSSYSPSKDRDIKFLIALVTLGDFMPYSHQSQQHQQYYRHQHNHHYAIKRNATKHTELSSIQQACQSRSFARQRVVLNSLIT